MELSTFHTNKAKHTPTDMTWLIFPAGGGTSTIFASMTSAGDMSLIKNNTKNWFVVQAIAQIFEVHPLFSSFKRRNMNVHNEENQMAADNILVVAEQM